VADDPHVFLRAEARDAGINLEAISDEDLPALMVTAERMAEQEGISRWAALGELVAGLEDEALDVGPGE
jgi:hypothetical protein